jgi:hypothetical protein
MCDRIHIESERLDIETSGELRAFLKGRELVFNAPEMIDDGPDDYCLCCVDVEATLKMHGYLVERDEAYNWLVPATSAANDPQPQGDSKSSRQP